VSQVGGFKPAAGSFLRQYAQPGLHWLWLLVAFQLAIPASYYLRSDAADERFAWRMFSAVRVEQCDVRAYLTPSSGERERVDLARVLHSGWITGLERGRRRVIERFLSGQCRPGQVHQTELRRACEDAAGRRTLERFHMDCASSRFSREVAP